MLRKVKVDPITRDRLGKATLAEVRARLLAIDCQTCGRPFDAATPGLVVHRDGDRITATLHHQHCGEPRWVDQPAPPAAGPPTLTWRATMLLPEHAGPPVFLVNPSCESTELRWTGTGWWPAELDGFVATGLTDDAAYVPAEELEELTATLEQGQVRVDLTTEDRTFAWSSKASPEVMELLDERGELLVAVTQLRDPAVAGDLPHGAGALACGIATVRYAPEVQFLRAGDVVEEADEATPHAVVAACEGDLGPIEALTGDARALAALRVAARYRSGHVVVFDDPAAARLMGLYKLEAEMRRVNVTQLPDHRGDIVIGTPARFAAARARDPRFAARLAAVVDVYAPPDLLRPYRRVLRILSTEPDPTERLMAHRVVYLGADIDDSAANRLTAQLLLLEAEDPNTDIAFYINSKGGSVSATMAIIDTMQLVKPDIATWVMGLATGSAQLLATCGAPGKRHALPHARIGMRRISAPPSPDAMQIMLLEKWTNEITGLIADGAGQTVEQVRHDLEHERWFTAAEAAEYGLVDVVADRPTLRTP